MQRLFSSFPGGRPGVGLLLLRMAACGAAFAQAWRWLEAGDLWPMAVLASLAIAAAASLLAGFLTPLAAVVAACIVPAGGAASTPYLLCIAAAIVLLGPGALSVDARLYGRREIVIDGSQ